MDNTNKVPDFLAMAKDLTANAQRYAGSESVKFFKESFVKEGFTDTSFTAWKPTTNPMAAKRTMYNKGILMQSIRKIEQNKQRIVVESNTPYSEINNEGGTITVTPQMKRFFWAKYYEFANKQTYNVKRKKLQNTSKNRSLSRKAEFFKALALMKVGSKITIPKRQFMGNSQSMMNMFDTFWQGQVDIVFKQHLNDKKI